MFFFNLLLIRNETSSKAFGLGNKVIFSSNLKLSCCLICLLLLEYECIKDNADETDALNNCNCNQGCR